MSKAKAIATATALPTSMRDAGYRFAQSGETLATMAAWIHEKCPGFLDEIPKEIKEDLMAGFQLRKHELTGSKFYRIGDGGTYIPLGDKAPEDMTRVVEFTINSAMALTPHEFGQLKGTDPAKHAVIGPLRDAFSTYASNKLGDLRREIGKLVNGAKPRTRSPNAAFNDAMKKAFESFDKRVKTAQSKGDASADPAKFRAAVDAFWKVYNG